MGKNDASKVAPSGGSAVKMNTTTHHCSNTNWEWMMFLKDQRTTNGELMHCKNMSAMTCHKHLSSTKSFSICILSQKPQRISWKMHNKWSMQSKMVMWLEPLNKQRSSPVAFSSKKASCQKVMQTFLNALKFISSEKFHIHCNLFLSLLECKNDSKWGIPHTWPTLMHSAKMCDTNRWLLFVHHWQWWLWIILCHCCRDVHPIQSIVICKLQNSLTCNLSLHSTFKFKKWCNSSHGSILSVKSWPSSWLHSRCQVHPEKVHPPPCFTMDHLSHLLMNSHCCCFLFSLFLFFSFLFSFFSLPWNLAPVNS